MLHQALITLPEEDYIYYADTDNVPYGVKSKEEIIQYVDGAIDFLISKGVKAIVIACNTATSVAIDYLRSKYSLPILGMEPAVKSAIKKGASQRVMVIATPLTVREDKLRNLLHQVDDDHLVDLLPLPKLVSFAEAGMFEEKEVKAYLANELAFYHLKDYSALVLGCTHFNYFKDTFRGVFPEKVEFIDGSTGTVNHLKHILEENGLLEHNTGVVDYYISGRLVAEEEMLADISRLHERLERMLQY